jgi:hypothetical protein
MKGFDVDGLWSCSLVGSLIQEKFYDMSLIIETEKHRIRRMVLRNHVAKKVKVEEDEEVHCVPGVDVIGGVMISTGAVHTLGSVHLSLVLFATPIDHSFEPRFAP